ncbi:MAG: hypothetical protein K2Y27_28150 [Xanthobacteraceae bacterium]|nr:hypothetical protein [Xanthobacteraceae bacterium]
MALLPNCDKAILDLRKIEHYCLDHTHPRGRHKARVLRQALGLTRGDAEWFRNALLEAIQTTAATMHREDHLGTQWRADISVTRHGRRAVVRTV